MLLAVRNMRAKTRTGGLLLASIRDYDGLMAQRPRAELPRIFDDPGGRRIVFQVWDWEDGGRTDVHLPPVRRPSGRSGLADSAPRRALSGVAAG